MRAVIAVHIALLATLVALKSDLVPAVAHLEAQQSKPIQSSVGDVPLVTLNVKGVVVDRNRGPIGLTQPVDIGLMNSDRRALKRLTGMAPDGSFGFTVPVTPGRYFVVAVAGGKKLSEAVVTAAREGVAGVIEILLVVLPDGPLSCGVENIGNIAVDLLPPSGPASPALKLAAKPALVKSREYFYATNRGRTFSGNPVPPYYGEDPPPDGAMSFGNFWVADTPSAPLQLKVVGDVDFYSKLKSAVALSPERKLLIFVHGYLSTFRDAMETTARLDAALKFNGPVLMFSWPSQNSLSPVKYSAARLRANEAALNLQSVLNAILKAAPSIRVDVIVHSLGGQVLSEVIAHVGSVRTFNQVVFFAPDVSANFVKMQAKTLQSIASRVTIYGSSHDCALQAAELVSDVGRAGQAGSAAGILVVPPAESVDVSAAVAADDVLGHSYYGSTRVSEDLVKVLAGVPPDKGARALDPSRTPPPHWLLRP